MESELDNLDRRLLDELQRDARLSYSALGRRVGLSQPAVAERVRRLEDAGVLTAYRARIDRTRAGVAVTAFLRVQCTADRFQAVHRLSRELTAVLECHHITGGDCFLIKVTAGTIARLERVIERFREHGDVVSSVVLSTVVEDKPVALPGAAADG